VARLPSDRPLPQGIFACYNSATWTGCDAIRSRVCRVLYLHLSRLNFVFDHTKCRGENIKYSCITGMVEVPMNRTTFLDYSGKRQENSVAGFPRGASCSYVMGATRTQYYNRHRTACPFERIRLSLQAHCLSSPGANA
jgi:hypothetical protein